MFLKCAIILISLTVQNIFAKNITVFSRKTNFTLSTSNPDNIKLKGHQINLSLMRNKCNGNLIDRFINKINILLRTKALSKNKGKNRFLISVDGKKYYENRKSKVGLKFLSIPSEFQRIKIQEKMLCSKD